MEYTKLVKTLRDCSANVGFCNEIDCPMIEYRKDYECIWYLLSGAANAIEDLMKGESK